MKKNKKITICITAHNEEKNINSLILSLLNQKGIGSLVKNILIVSDGSSDNTVSEVKKVKSKKIILIEGIEKKGKAERLNQLFKLCDSDILIQLDADIVLKKSDVILELAKPILANAKVDFVCGNHGVLITNSYFNQITSFGIKVWEDAIDSITDNNILYRCTGQIRAFSKRFYKKLTYPKNLMLSEDIYSFYFAIKNNFNIVFSRKAYVYYKLASNPFDYIKQLARFVDTKTQREKYFNHKLIKKYETMSLKTYLISLIKIMLKTNIVISVGFLLLHSATRFYKKFYYKPKANWDIAYSTK